MLCPLGVVSLWRWWTVQTVRFAAWPFAPPSPRTVTPAHPASAPATEPATHTCTLEVHMQHNTQMHWQKQPAERMVLPAYLRNEMCVFVLPSLITIILHPGADSPTCSNGVTPPNKSKSHGGTSSSSVKYPSASSSASSSTSSSPSSVNYSESNSSDSTKSQPHSANSTQETRWEGLSVCIIADNRLDESRGFCELIYNRYGAGCWYWY